MPRGSLAGRLFAEQTAGHFAEAPAPLAHAAPAAGGEKRKHSQPHHQRHDQPYGPSRAGIVLICALHRFRSGARDASLAPADPVTPP